MYRGNSDWPNRGNKSPPCLRWFKIQTLDVQSLEFEVLEFDKYFADH